MIGRIYHVGLTVSDIDRSIAFYRDILGLEFQGELFMEGEETDKMFRKKNCKARVAYLNGSKAIEAPPYVNDDFNKIESTPQILFEYFPCSTSVLSRQYCSTSPSVLQYCQGSTGIG